jgi:hypothetical protein
MADGRLLFSSWQRSTVGAAGNGGRVRLFGVNLDGTDYALFADPAGPAIHHMPCITPSGLVVFVAADRVPWDGAGQLASVSYRRPLNSFRMLSEPGDGLYHSPSPLPDGAVVVARRPADGTGTHAVGRFDLATGQWQAVFDDPDWHDIQPRSVYRRAPVDGRSSVVNEEKPNGKLYCLNVYETDLARSDWLPPGSVKRVRVLEGFRRRLQRRTPTAAGRSDAAALAGDGRRWTAADSGRGGSVGGRFVSRRGAGQYAAGIADAGRRRLGFAVVRLDLGEEPREPRLHRLPRRRRIVARQSRFADALALSAAPLAPPEAQRRTVDFRRDLMPIIQTKCVPCHGGAARETGQAHLDQPAISSPRGSIEPVRSPGTGQAEPKDGCADTSSRARRAPAR